MSAGTLSGMVAAPQVVPRALLGARDGRDETDVLSGNVEQLCQTFQAVCASAVDPLEIAAALEFDGMSDQTALGTYGAADVFTLAETMFEHTVRAPVEPEPVADPWRVSRLHTVLHGLLYGLPAVCFPAAAALLSGPGARTMLVVSLLASWATGQGLAHLGYLRLGRTGRDAARRVMRAGLVVSLAISALVLATAALVVPVRLGALAFAAGQAAYMLGASVLLVLGMERRLLLVLAPAVLGSAAYLLLGHPAWLTYPVWAALAVSPLLAVGLALVCCWRAEPLPGALFPAADLRAALPSVLFGLLAAALLGFPFLAGIRLSPTALLGALPVSLSMGAAEWSLYSYRRRTQALLHECGDLVSFARGTRRVLLSVTARYLVMAALLIALVVALAAATHLVRPQWSDVPGLASYWALGGAMFVGLLLQTMREWTAPLLCCLLALLALLLTWRFAAAQLAVNAALLLTLTVYSAVVLDKAGRHAY